MKLLMRISTGKI